MREFGYAWDEVHDEAEVLEHAISDRLLEGIDERLGRPRVRPARRCDPGCLGPRRTASAFVLLGEAPPGHVGRVLRVSDRDPELLRAVEAAGVAVGAEATVPDASTLRIAGCEVALPDAAAGAVWLSA